MISNIDDYFALGCGRCARFATADCSTRRWQDGLLALRRLCLDAGLVETVKWGHPCYLHGKRNVAIIGALRRDFSLAFFDAGTLRDPAQVLQRRGPNSRHADTMRFTDVAQVEAMAPTIRAYLAAAMHQAEAGVRQPRTPQALTIPPELAEAFDADPELAAAFARLTPGRQRSYVLNLGAARKPETRRARIAKFRPRILAGKGAMER